jgi:hypothetical protein
MGYRLNAKNLTVTRLMPRGPKAEKRLKYLHASSLGTVARFTNALTRRAFCSTLRHR